ncbi:nucleotidyltransferase family protein [Methylococcus sp. EFPC2]|uniref:nucleotidyltransferase domain-containing protein n=1 Tax=Methylococcus sp. EFPC2 TaxID=2812648 RepID=UPI001967D180|nr:nucleotidyltransferase family protein [Methylococcus sp. EFPC2]QSA95515.1 nucleotidyltransferase family protein [Methylococcus sp. EFPC2]
MESLTLREWDVLLPLARSTRLLARLGALAHDVGIWEDLPDQVRLHMTGAEVQVGAQQRVAAWELDRLHRVLGECPFPVILLKGAAYLQGGLQVGRGRDFADVDILVPRTHIDEAENALKAAGWVSGALSEYDERYYRDWMHEIPPLRHPDRWVEVDVHHTLLPVTGRIQLVAGRLFEESRPLPDSRFRILGAEDLVLHSATHLFTSGECERALRDLSDLDLLLRQFAAETPGYYDRLLRRAEELNLGRILYYALHGVHAALNTPIPEEVLRACDRFGPPVAWARFMNAVFLAAFAPEVSGLSNLARGFLFLRSHWLKMPFILLVRHLWTKAYASH